jgi:regulator of sigma E protease
MGFFIGLIFGIGLMVFIHELGHFVAAKMNGVEVETFSLGWGPRLVGFRHRGTSYQISWFPIGGYCKMKGEMVPGMAGGGAETAVPRAPEKGSFLAASSWRRAVIYVFGPLFNLLFALLVTAIIWWAGFTTFSSDNRVILATDYTLDTFPAPTPAATAGLKTGDRITAINGTAVENFQDIVGIVSTAPGRDLLLTVLRSEGGTSRTLALHLRPELDKNTGAGRIGIYSWVDPVFGAVTPGSAWAIAGLLAGDRIVALGGKPVANSIDVEQSLASKPAKVEVTYERAGARETVPVVLDWSGTSPTGEAFVLQAFRSPRLGPIQAVERSARETWSTAAETVKGIGLLFRGVNLRNAVAGPIGIASLIGNATISGFQRGIGAGVVTFFQLLSLLSVVLFLMNLLPIPAMDGGQIVLLVVEIIRRKPAKVSLVWRLQIIGFTLMLTILVLATLNDVWPKG